MTMKTNLLYTLKMKALSLDDGATASKEKIAIHDDHDAKELKKVAVDDNYDSEKLEKVLYDAAKREEEEKWLSDDDSDYEYFMVN